MEKGVKMINGSDRGPAAPEAPPKERRFLNGWTREQEILMAEWSDLAMCYRWLHDKSEKHFHSKTTWINLPVIILSTLGGTANFGIQSLFSDDMTKKYASFAIGGVSLFAGLLTTIGNYLRYAQLEESHRVASISWGKFQRLIAVELALNPDDRIDSMDFLKICRADLDRLIEQSPPIPEESIKLFEASFGLIADLKKPDICGALEHTRVFESSQSRLKQVLSDAALMIRHKRRTLNELLSPQIQDTIKKQVETRLQEALEERKNSLVAEMELEKASIRETEEEYQRALEERRRKIHSDIDNELQTKKKETVTPSAKVIQPHHSKFEGRLQLKMNPLFSARVVSPEKKRKEEPVKEDPPMPSLETLGDQNVVIIPSSTGQADKSYV
jgi:Skp family chaperone for outer membrane proteins